MTWVIATSSIFGYAAGLADVRVTFQDGTEADCLQKIYPVGRFIAGGFSGSVMIGMNLLSILSELLSTSGPNECWDLDEVAKWWTDDARTVFPKFPESERLLGCNLVILGAGPPEGRQIFGTPAVYTFNAPLFEPLKARMMDIVSIGKGSTIKTYTEVLAHLSKNHDLLQAEAGRPGGTVSVFEMFITKRIESLPISGISPHLHLCVVFPDRIEVGVNNRYYHGARPDFTMPNVASNYTEFLTLAGSLRRSAAGAVG
jgi:hypothetical protein